jgi:hypothetical protein
MHRLTISTGSQQQQYTGAIVSSSIAMFSRVTGAAKKSCVSTTSGISACRELASALPFPVVFICICSKFYDRLKELREYHKRFPVYDISAAEEDSSMLTEEPKLDFSGEEGLGR